MRDTTTEYLACAASLNRYPISSLEWADPLLRWETVVTNAYYPGVQDCLLGKYYSVLVVGSQAWRAWYYNNKIYLHLTTDITSASSWQSATCTWNFSVNGATRPALVPVNSTPWVLYTKKNDHDVWGRVLSPNGPGNEFQVTAFLSFGSEVPESGLAGAFWSNGYITMMRVMMYGNQLNADEYVVPDNCPPGVTWGVRRDIVLRQNIGSDVYYSAFVPNAVYLLNISSGGYTITSTREFDALYPVINTDPDDNWYTLRVWQAFQTPGGEYWAVGRVGRRGSSGQYLLSFVAILRSADGVHWSLDRYSFVTTTGGDGFILPGGSDLYYIAPRLVMRAPQGILYTGSWSGTVADINPYQWNSDTGKNQNAASFTTVIHSGEAASIPPGAWLRRQVGYRDAGGDHLIQYSVEGVDAIQEQKAPGVESATIHSRDLGMRLLYDHCLDYDAVYESTPVGFTNGSTIAPLYPVSGPSVKVVDPATGNTGEVSATQMTPSGTSTYLEYQAWNDVSVFFSAEPISAQFFRISATFGYSTNEPSGVPLGLNVIARRKIRQLGDGGTATLTKVMGEDKYILRLTGGEPFARDSNPAHDYTLGFSSQSHPRSGPRTVGDESLYGVSFMLSDGRIVYGFLRERTTEDGYSAVVTKDLLGTQPGLNGLNDGETLNNTIVSYPTAWRIGINGKTTPFYGYGLVFSGVDAYNFSVAALDIVGKRVMLLRRFGNKDANGWLVYAVHDLSSYTFSRNNVYQMWVEAQPRGTFSISVSSRNPSGGTDWRWYFTMWMPWPLIQPGKLGVALCQAVAETLCEGFGASQSYAPRAWGLWGRTSQALLHNNNYPLDNYQDWVVGKPVDLNAGEETCDLIGLAQSNRKMRYLWSYGKITYHISNSPYYKVWYATLSADADPAYGGRPNVDNANYAFVVLAGSGVGIATRVGKGFDGTAQIPGHNASVYAVHLPDTHCAKKEDSDGARYTYDYESFDRIGPCLWQGTSVLYAVANSYDYAEAGIVPALVLGSWNGGNPKYRYQLQGRKSFYGQVWVRQHNGEKLRVYDFMAADLGTQNLTLDFVLRDLMARAGVLRPASYYLVDQAYSNIPPEGVRITPAIGDYNFADISLLVEMNPHSIPFSLVLRGGRLKLSFVNSSGYEKYQMILYQSADGATWYEVDRSSIPYLDSSNVYRCLIFVWDRFISFLAGPQHHYTVLRAARLPNHSTGGGWDEALRARKGEIRLYASSGTLTVKVPELYHRVVAAVVESGSSTVEAIRNAVQDLRLILVPTADGQVRYGLLDYSNGTLRDQIGTITDLTQGENGFPAGGRHASIFAVGATRTDRVPTLYQVIGEETTNYLSEEHARRYGLLFARKHTPSLKEEAAYQEAIRSVRDAVSYALPVDITVAAQPHWEIEDLVNVQLPDGQVVQYAVDRISISAAPGEFIAAASLRRWENV